MSEIEYDPSGEANLSFQVGAEILNLSLLYAVYIDCCYMLYVVICLIFLHV